MNLNLIHIIWLHQTITIKYGPICEQTVKKKKMFQKTKKCKENLVWSFMHNITGYSQIDHSHHKLHKISIFHSSVQRQAEKSFWVFHWPDTL